MCFSIDLDVYTKKNCILTEFTKFVQVFIFKLFMTNQL